MWNYPEEYLGKPNNLEQYYKLKPTKNEDNGGGLGLLLAPVLFFVLVLMYYGLFLLAVPFLPVSIIVYEAIEKITQNNLYAMISASISFVVMIGVLVAAAYRSKSNEFLFWGIVYLFSILSLLYLSSVTDNRAATGSIEKLNDIKEAFFHLFQWIYIKFS
jgi:hypothetical protein